MGFNNSFSSVSLSGFGDGITHPYSGATFGIGVYDKGSLVSVVERSAKATPEPTTIAGLALVGLVIAGTRRKKTKAAATV